MAVLPPVSNDTDSVVFVKLARGTISSAASPDRADIPITVYLDEGSKLTYIREALAGELALPFSQSTTIMTGSFGGRTDTH
jgi:hypothetical protein